MGCDGMINLIGIYVNLIIVSPRVIINKVVSKLLLLICVYRMAPRPAESSRSSQIT